MTHARRSRRLRAVAATTAAGGLAALALLPAAGHAAGRTETIRAYSVPVLFTYTAPGAAPTHVLPQGPPAAGATLEIYSKDFAGNHRKHARRAAWSDYTKCTFAAGTPEPSCESVVAIGGSLLMVRDDAVTGGTGRYLGATGKVVATTVTDERNDSDVVVRVKLA